jgi:hypothetical protein
MAVPMPAFPDQFGIPALFGIRNLHNPQGFFKSWFESMPGSQIYGSLTAQGLAEAKA